MVAQRAVTASWIVEGVNRLASLREGDRVSALGPLGNRVHRDVLRFHVPVHQPGRMGPADPSPAMTRTGDTDHRPRSGAVVTVRRPAWPPTPGR